MELHYLICYQNGNGHTYTFVTEWSKNTAISAYTEIKLHSSIYAVYADPIVRN